MLPNKHHRGTQVIYDRMLYWEHNIVEWIRLSEVVPLSTTGCETFQLYPCIRRPSGAEMGRVGHNLAQDLEQRVKSGVAGFPTVSGFHCLNLSPPNVSFD